MKSSPVPVLTSHQDTIITPVTQLLMWEQLRGNQPYMRQTVGKKSIAYTWKDVASLARRVANRLVQQGLPAGSRIGIYSKNCPEWFIADLGIMMAGHISVPILSAVNADTLAHIISHAEIQTLFVGQVDIDATLELQACPQLNTISFPLGAFEAAMPWHQYIECGELRELHTPMPEDILTIIYTSGSTGVPKGVVHTYRSFSFAVSCAQQELMLTTGDRLLSYLPLGHVVERLLIEFVSLYTGCNVWFVEQLDTFSRDIQACQPTFFVSVPRLWAKFQQSVEQQIGAHKLTVLLSIPGINMLVRRAIKKRLGLNKANVFASGSAPLPVSTLHWFRRLGINISEGWGMTENCGFGTVNLPFRGDKAGSIGHAMAGVTLRITPEGELQSHSLANMQGYYKDEKSTRAAFTADGFLQTGDLAEIDSEGYVVLTGRLKDLFKTSKGKYIAPAPIETLLTADPNVEFACVMGTWLPQPVALVKLNDSVLSSEQYTAYFKGVLTALNKRLESHEKLDAIYLIDDIWSAENGMITPTLKIRRHQIEQRYAGQLQHYRKVSIS
ncbi:MAG: AMP-binding protein [Flavobacteriaceae bacterium]|nr:AMP-binding protein [Flavobacteriaceae bacterium]